MNINSVVIKCRQLKPIAGLFIWKLIKKMLLLFIALTVNTGGFVAYFLLFQ